MGVKGIGRMIHFSHLGWVPICCSVLIALATGSNGLDLQTRTFSLKQIKAATDDFDPSNKIGEGGFGPVYKVSYCFVMFLCLFSCLWTFEHPKTTDLEKTEPFLETYLG